MIYFISFFVLYVQVLMGEPIAVITNMSGNAVIQHQADTISMKAALFDELHAGDSLFVRSGNVTIFYNCGTIAAIDSGGILVIPFAEDSVRGMGQDLFELVGYDFSPLFTDGEGSEKIMPKVVLQALGEDSVHFSIYIPGNTSLLDARPDVAWNSYPDANWYSVTFQKKGEIIINNATTDTIMPYFEQNESLEPATYLVRVSAFYNNDTLVSTQCFIEIIDSATVHDIKSHADVLDRVDADICTQSLLKALFYQSHSLYHQAIMHYETLIKEKPDEPFAYKAIANLYQLLGVPDQVNAYLKRYDALTIDH